MHFLAITQYVVVFAICAIVLRLIKAWIDNERVIRFHDAVNRNISKRDPFFYERNVIEFRD